MKLLRYAFAGLSLALLLTVTAGKALAASTIITVNENGQGTLKFPDPDPALLLTGVLAPDPGPSGLASALTYNLGGPPSLVAGDVVILDSNGAISAIVRFNPAGTGSLSYPASLVFYSLLGGTGLPPGGYANPLTFTAVNGELLYIPSADQPGFVAGFNVSYQIINAVAIPEPATLVLLSTGLAGGIAAARRRRKAAR